MSALELALSVVGFFAAVVGIAWILTDLTAWWQRRWGR